MVDDNEFDMGEEDETEDEDDTEDDAVEMGDEEEGDMF